MEETKAESLRDAAKARRLLEMREIWRNGDKMKRES